MTVRLKLPAADGIEPVPDERRVLGFLDQGTLWANLGVSLVGDRHRRVAGADAQPRHGVARAGAGRPDRRLPARGVGLARRHHGAAGDGDHAPGARRARRARADGAQHPAEHGVERRRDVDGGRGRARAAGDRRRAADRLLPGGRRARDRAGRHRAARRRPPAAAAVRDAAARDRARLPADRAAARRRPRHRRHRRPAGHGRARHRGRLQRLVAAARARLHALLGPAGARGARRGVRLLRRHLAGVRDRLPGRHARRRQPTRTPS